MLAHSLADVLSSSDASKKHIEQRALRVRGAEIDE